MIQGDGDYLLEQFHEAGIYTPDEEAALADATLEADMDHADWSAPYSTEWGRDARNRALNSNHTYKQAVMAQQQANQRAQLIALQAGAQPREGLATLLLGAGAAVAPRGLGIERMFGLLPLVCSFIATAWHLGA